MSDEHFKNAVLKNKGEVTPPFDAMLDIMGFEGLRQLCDQVGGTTLYIPSLQNMFKGCLQKQIPTEFDGSNYRQLCYRYGLSERTIRNFVNPRLQNL